MYYCFCIKQTTAYEIRTSLVGWEMSIRDRLLAEWIRYSPSASDSGSLFTVMGKRDVNVVLVFTGKGPQFWSREDRRLATTQLFGQNQHYTAEFANEYMRHLLQAGGVYHKALTTLRSVHQQSGWAVTLLLGLAPIHS